MLKITEMVAMRDIKKIVSIGIRSLFKIIRKKTDSMVIVVSPLMHDKIIKIIDEIPGTNYQFIKKEGINLYFEVAPSSDEEAAQLIKSTLKANPISKALMFKVLTKEYI